MATVVSSVLPPDQRQRKAMETFVEVLYQKIGNSAT